MYILPTLEVLFHRCQLGQFYICCSDLVYVWWFLVCFFLSVIERSTLKFLLWICVSHFNVNVLHIWCNIITYIQFYIIKYSILIIMKAPLSIHFFPKAYFVQYLHKHARFCIFVKRGREVGWLWRMYLCTFFFFLLFKAASVAYGNSHARGQIRPVASGLLHSHCPTGSKPCLQPIWQLMAMPGP